MKKIIHLAPFNRNIGDNALNLAIEEMLGTRMKFERMELVGNPFDRKVYERLADSDGVIFGGGGVIHSCSGDNSRKNRTKSGTMWNMNQTLIRSIAEKTCLYSVGFNRFEGEPPPLDAMATFFGTLLSAGSLISMRNDGSAKRLSTYFPEFKGLIPTIPDPGLLYRGKAGFRQGNYVIVQIATDRLNFRYPDGLDSFIDLLNRILASIPYRKILLPHTNADEAVYRELGPRLAIDEVIPLNLSIKKTPEMIGLYAGAKFSISTRGHSQLCSIGNQCPTFAISTHSKVKGFFDTIGMSRYCFDYLKEDKKTALDKFEKFMAEVPKIKRSLKGICRGFQKEADTYNLKVIDFFENGAPSHSMRYKKPKITRGVVYAADGKYFEGFKTSLRSLRVWHPMLPVTLFDLGLNQSQKEWCEKNNVSLKDLNFLKNLNVKIIEKQHLTTAAIASLYIYRSDYEEVLFLDADVLILGSIEPFFDGLKTHDIVAVQGSALRRHDSGHSHLVSDEISPQGRIAVAENFSGIDLGHPAINTGCFAAHSSLFESWEPFHGGLFRIFEYFRYADQSAINLLRCYLRPKEKILPAQFDFTGISITDSWNSIDDRLTLSITDGNKLHVYLDDTRINVLHFSGRNKPWSAFAFTRRSFAWAYFVEDHSIKSRRQLEWYDNFRLTPVSDFDPEAAEFERLPRLEKIDCGNFLEGKGAFAGAQQAYLMALAENNKSPLTYRKLYFCMAGAGALKDARRYLNSYLRLRPTNLEMKKEKACHDFLRHLDSGAAIIAKGKGRKSISSKVLDLTSRRFGLVEDYLKPLFTRIKDLESNSVLAISDVLQAIKLIDINVDLRDNKFIKINRGFWNKINNSNIRFQMLILAELNIFLKDGRFLPSILRVSKELTLLDSILSSTTDREGCSQLYIDPFGCCVDEDLRTVIGQWQSKVVESGYVYTTLPYLSRDAYDSALSCGRNIEVCFAEQEVIDLASSKGFELVYHSWREDICHLFFIYKTKSKLSNISGKTTTKQNIANRELESELKVGDDLAVSTLGLPARMLHSVVPSCESKGWVHQSWANSRNFGDRMLSSMVKSVVRYDHFFDQENLCLDLSKPLTKEDIELISESELLVIGGGGIFIPDSAMGRQTILRTPPKDLEQIETTKAFFAVDINAIGDELEQASYVEAVGSYLSCVDYIGFRSHHGIDWIKRNFEEEIFKKCFYQPCPTLFISELEEDKNALRVLKPREQVKQVGFNFSFDRLGQRDGGRLGHILEEITTCAKTLVQEGVEVCVLIHCPEDRLLLEIFKGAGVRCREIPLTTMTDRQAMSAYAGLDLVVGTRLHSIFIPYGLTVPVIPIALHPKLKWAAQDLQIQYHWSPLDQASPKLLALVEEAIKPTSLANQYTINRQNNISNFRISRLNLAKIAIHTSR